MPDMLLLAAGLAIAGAFVLAPLWRSGTATAPGTRRVAAVTAAVIGLALLVGSLVPAAGLANRTEENRALADAQAAEAQREERIATLLDRIGADPDDAEAYSELADAYLAGAEEEDLVRAAVALQVLIALEPERTDAYERIVAAYLRAGDATNARAALDAYGELDAADPVEVAFLDGLIARQEGHAAAAVAAFDRFLELAPDDPREPMVRSLRAEAEESR